MDFIKQPLSPWKGTKNSIKTGMRRTLVAGLIGMKFQENMDGKPVMLYFEPLAFGRWPSR